jgi:hypothetical protein
MVEVDLPKRVPLAEQYLKHYYYEYGTFAFCIKNTFQNFRVGVPLNRKAFLPMWSRTGSSLSRFLKE